jgi:hypothetical protein
MWISLTKNPMNPIMKKPTHTALASAVNSLRSGLVHFLTKCIESLANCFKGSMRTLYFMFRCNRVDKNIGFRARRIKRYMSSSFHITYLFESFFFRHFVGKLLKKSNKDGTRKYRCECKIIKKHQFESRARKCRCQSS